MLNFKGSCIASLLAFSSVMQCGSSYTAVPFAPAVSDFGATYGASLLHCYRDLPAFGAGAHVTCLFEGCRCPHQRNVLADIPVAAEEGFYMV
jgi:hypothetical protein